jgi:hypothetical protein
MIVEEKRKRDFAVSLDQLLQENIDCYIDEMGEPIPCPYNEGTVYNWLMEQKDYHLLTTTYVKNMIHLFMTDFKARMEYMHKNNLL